ncbi:M67 family metallopeptidase [Paenibacillus eucommiae]|uniref:Proteasome lid subunit RPN8/RPN11 n=1 Tax=Paenibacillus eucommiae TaxID=1355755 RepID=A0ABS4IRP7_9BACL|nr:M67 family metallopeptidase [Paenibacillus eucommiae]MBP1989249.1 proteasome lid subunit RPN8/RPN11 [Paenibacillus eucommiae]
MTVLINAALYEGLLQYCSSKLPEEACGFITGNTTGDGYMAVSFIPVTNIASNSKEHFEMSPVELIPILYRQAEAGDSIIGMFHSHPLQEAVPSSEDLNTLWHTLPTYWIVSLSDSTQPLLHIYTIKKAPLLSIHKLAFVMNQ